MSRRILRRTSPPGCRREAGRAAAAESLRRCFFRPLVAELKEPLSASYCFCSAGWLREVYETVSGKPVTVEILETVKRGGKLCRFNVKLSA